MAEETTPNPQEAKPAAAKPKKVKPPALEDKPFAEFIQQHFNPALEKALAEKGIADLQLNFTKDKLPIEGVSQEECWQIAGNWNQGERQFNLYFLEEKINGAKAFSCATNNSKPSVIESFMIDERKVTLDLMVLYTLQRLNGQKWLTRN